MNVTNRKVAGCVAFAAAFATSILAGTPNDSDLPEIALDWPLLLHVERAAALIGLLSLLALVWWRASQGEFPTRFGNIEYAVEDAAAEAEKLALNQEGRIVILERAMGLRDKGLVSPGRET